MSWIKGSATNYLTLSDAIHAAMVGSSLQTAVLGSSGGSGYAIGDFLDIVGGTGTVTAQVEVLTLSGSAVATVRISNAGVYTVAPGTTNIATTAATGSGDDLCVLNLTWAANGWTSRLNGTYSGSEKEVILEGNGDGADEIFVGWRTYSDVPAGRFNMELHGMTGWNTLLPFDEQPGISPGFFDGPTTALTAGCYLLLHNTTIPYWMTVTSFRVTGVVKIGSAFYPFSFGWGNRVATEAEYPYPMHIAGCSSLSDDIGAQSKLTSGLTDPWRSNASGGTAQGPTLVYFNDNQWHGVANSQISISSRTILKDRVVLPAGVPAGILSAAPADQFIDSIGSFIDLIEENNPSGSPTAHLHPTPGTADLREMIPTLIVFTAPSEQVVLEIDDVWWVSSFGGVISEDRYIDENDNVYRVFQNGNRTDAYAFFALKEV